MVTIRNDQIRRVTASKGGVTIADPTSGTSITASLNQKERRTLAAALDPDRATGGQWTGGQWTRDDLPSEVPSGIPTPYVMPGGMRDHLAEWLNANHPKPVPYDQGGWPEGWQTVANMEARAVTAEVARDAAVERVARRDEEIDLIARQCAEARAERDAAIARAEQAESERDGWRENAEHRSTIIEQLRDRAEKAERELVDHYSETNQKAASWDRVVAHPALRLELLPTADNTYAGGVFERITRLAETAEAVTEMTPASAVSRAEIGNALIRVGVSNGVETHVEVSEGADAVWALVSGDDPAVFIVRESDIAAVKVERVRDEEWHANGTLVAWTGESAEDVRGQQDTARRNFIHREAVARAIEAEQTVDPVETKAEELYGVLNPLGAWDLALEDSENEERERYRRLAAHVLGQEADQ